MSKKSPKKQKTTEASLGYAESSAQPDKPSENDGPQKYEIESAADTLLKAEEIKANEKLMPHVHKLLAKKKKHLESVSSIKELRSKISHDMASED